MITYEDVNANYSVIRGRCQPSRRYRTLYPNAVHSECLPSATYDKRPFATQLLSGEGKAKSCENNLDYAVNSCGKKPC